VSGWHHRHSGQRWSSGQMWHSGQRWQSGKRWHLLWCCLSALVRWRCTCFFLFPACLRILCSAILARQAYICLVLTKYHRVSFYCSLYLLMPQKLDTPLFLFSDFGTRFLHQRLGFLYCSALKPAGRHFGHIQRQAHVGLFQLCTTSLPCHSSRHVENLQEISC